MAACCGDVRYGELAQDKVRMRATYTVVGFLPHPGAVGALYLARKEGKNLIYVGKAGTGFTRKVAADIRRCSTRSSYPRRSSRSRSARRTRCGSGHR